MAKKRKSNAKEEPNPKQMKQESKPVIPLQHSDSESESDSESDEYEEVEEEEEEEDEPVEESSPEQEEQYPNRETIKEILEQFGKDQLVELIKDAAAKNPSLVTEIVSSAESHAVHRKIFIHGLSWDTTKETLASFFKQYGPIEDCKVVTDKATGKSKGYGFVFFKTRAGARKALKQPQKKIDNRMTSCQLASSGPNQNQPVSDGGGGRKLFVANVGPQVNVEKLRDFFAKFGEIEEGPLGFDKVTGKFRGFAIIIYKTVDGIKKALEEPVKSFEGCNFQCSKAAEGRVAKTGASASEVGGSATGVPPVANAPVMPSNIALPTLPMGFNQGLIGQNLNPGAVLWGQNPGFGLLNPVLSMGTGMPLSQTGLAPSFPGGASQPMNRVGLSAGFGAQPGINSISPSVISSYGSQAALQGLGAYQSSRSGQSSVSTATAAAKPQTGIGSLGTLPSYLGR